MVSSLNATFVNVRRIEEELRREINRSTGKDDLHDTQIANLRQDLTSTNEMLNQEINRSVAKDKEHDELLEGLRDDVDSTSSKPDARSTGQRPRTPSMTPCSRGYEWTLTLTRAP